MAGEQQVPMYIPNDDYDSGLFGFKGWVDRTAGFTHIPNSYPVKPNPAYPWDKNLIDMDKLDAAYNAYTADQNAEKQALQEQYNATMAANKQKGQVYNPVTQQTEAAIPTAKGYSSAYYKGEFDKLAAELARKEAAIEARNKGLGQWFPGIRAAYSGETESLRGQVDEAKKLYEASLANERAAMEQRAQRQEAGRINQGMRDNSINQIVRPDQIDKNVAMANYKTATVTPTESSAANNVGSMFGVPNTQNATTTTTSLPSTSTAIVTTQSATQPTTTKTAGQGTTAKPTTSSTGTTGSSQSGTSGQTTTTGSVYQGGLPPQTQQVQQPVTNQPVYQGQYAPPGYVPPQVREGYDIVGSAKDPILPGQPISRAVARAMYRRQAETNQAYNQMMSSARTAQVADSMNNPDTYRLAQELATQGLPADQAMYMAMAQVNAANQNWLGLGATIPVAQKGLSDLNNYNMGTAMMFGVPFEQTVVRGPYNFNNPNVYSIDPNGTVTTSAGTFKLTPEQQVAFAVNNPQFVNEELFKRILGNGSYGNTYTRNPGGSPQAVSAAANAAQNAQAKADKQNGTAVTNQQQSATNW